MKRHFLSLAGLLLWTASCTPEPFESPDGRYDLSAGIEGRWIMTAVEVEDRSFPTFSTKDFSEYYNKSEVTLQFNTADNSYSSAGASEGLPFLGGGFYTFDNPKYPSKMYLRPTATGDTLTLDLGNMVRSIDQKMALYEVKSTCQEVYAQYTYRFTRKQ